MIIIIGCNKGGAGKSTLATNLAVGLTLRGKDIVLVDADRQRSASKWHQYRIEENHKPDMLVVAKEDNIAVDLSKLNEKYEFVIVDVAGRNSRELITGATVADLLIAPHQASQLDLDTLNELHEQLIRIKDLNPDLEAYIYHSMAHTNASVKENEREEFINYAAEFPQLKQMQSMNFYRKVYRDVIPQGLSVLESDNVQAKAEMNQFIDEILRIIQ
ncbi:division plane positioning ATPase MipZ [Desulfopila aestuarii]|uniref:Plasmid segregation oscillating ATPase ParF n=1 Tax=Desulfopila aestuarii DSM 18488 TaxID=1121416 RepID=A0A1M7YHC7_9BACT|nr:division plane positioning ATPase MipZ [Desulfopila aestuarii]SHO52030.1 plasmid segregation oscillating ATPase ParF [Desulfopila aestuarii DSM 18488]